MKCKFCFLFTRNWGLTLNARINEYADLRPNKILCKLYADAMEEIHQPVECDFESPRDVPGSTDQGLSTSTMNPSIQAFASLQLVLTLKQVMSHTNVLQSMLTSPFRVFREHLTIILASRSALGLMRHTSGQLRRGRAWQWPHGRSLAMVS